MVARRLSMVIVRVVLVVLELVLRALGCTREREGTRGGVMEEQSSDFEENVTGVANKYFFDD